MTWTRPVEHSEGKKQTHGPHVTQSRLYQTSRLGRPVAAAGNGRGRLPGIVGRKQWEATEWAGGSFRGDEDVLELVVTAELLCDYTENHRLVHFKVADFVACESYIHLTEKRTKLPTV